MRKLALVLGAAALVSSGCGEEGISEGPSAQEGTAEPLLMRSTVTQADGLRAAVAGQNGEQIATAALALSAGAMGAVRPPVGAQRLAITEQMLTLAQAGVAGTSTGTRTCTPGGCTFESFGNGQFTITGSVTASDAPAGAKRIGWRLSGTASGGPGGVTIQGLDLAYSWKGDLTVSATTLTGAAGATWEGSGEAGGQSFSFEYGSFVKFQSIALVERCPTAGSVFAKWWVTAQAGGREQSQAYQATHRFNGCTR